MTWPTVDPIRQGDVWFGIGRLGRRSDATGCEVGDGSALEVARSMSRQAADMSADDADIRSKAASLRVQAAEGKRAAGASVEAFEDYEALTDHYLAAGSLKAAIAYMRKARHVSEMGGKPDVSSKALMLAAKVYLATGKQPKALVLAKQAADAAGTSGEPHLVSRAAELVGTTMAATALPKGKCGCGSDRKYTKCCGVADVPPLEYTHEAEGVVLERIPSPFRRGSHSGVETLMRPPAGGKVATWYAWRVQDGCFQLKAYANWSDRAIQAADTMARIAIERNCAAATSSAVLQSFVALESFLTSWKAHKRWETDNRHWPNDGIEKVRHKRRDGDGDEFVRWWAAAGRATCGDIWTMPDPKAFEVLVAIRNTICHEAASPLTVIPMPKRVGELVEELVKRGCRVGPSPMPLIDRVMTPDVAAWAVRTAKLQIDAVRDAWDLVDRDWEHQEDSYSSEPYPSDEEVGAQADLRDADPIECGPTRPDALVGLRRLARQDPSLLADMDAIGHPGS